MERQTGILDFVTRECSVVRLKRGLPSFFCVLLLAGCATTVTPPRDVAEPVTVYIVDHGRHASLLLPTGEPESPFVEYAFGDWRFFALNKKNYCTGFVALAFPTQSAFGRRYYNEEAIRSDRLLATLRAESVSAVEVEGRLARDLEAALGRRFDAGEGPAVKNERSGLDLVKDNRSYHVFRNSNQAVANWLRALGCEVDGPVFIANFELRPAVSGDKP